MPLLINVIFLNLLIQIFQKFFFHVLNSLKMRLFCIFQFALFKLTYKWLRDRCVTSYRLAVFINNKLGKIPLDKAILVNKRSLLKDF